MYRNIVLKITIAVVLVAGGLMALQPIAKASLALNTNQPNRLLKAPDAARFDAERFSEPGEQTSARFDSEPFAPSAQSTGARFDGEALPGVRTAPMPRFDGE